MFKKKRKIDPAPVSDCKVTVNRDKGYIYINSALKKEVANPETPKSMDIYESVDGKYGIEFQYDHSGNMSISDNGSGLRATSARAVRITDLGGKYVALDKDGIWELHPLEQQSTIKNDNEQEIAGEQNQNVGEQEIAGEQNQNVDEQEITQHEYEPWDENKDFPSTWLQRKHDKGEVIEKSEADFKQKIGKLVMRYMTHEDDMIYYEQEDDHGDVKGYFAFKEHAPLDELDDDEWTDDPNEVPPITSLQEN